MKRNVVKTAHAKGLALLLAAGMLVSQMSGVSADAKAKKPKLSRTKVSVTVGKTKRVTVKNAKKVTWKVTKKAAQIVKLTKKSKKGATIKGLKKGTAKISVQMKNGKKKVKKTITVKVSSAKKVVVPAEPAKTTQKPANGSTNGPTKEPVKEPTATPTATSTTEPSATPTATPLPDLVLEGDDLGAGASYTYVPNGFAQYSSMGIFEIDKSKLSDRTTISIKYTAMEGETDVKDTQGFNIGLKTGDKWNSPTINNYWGQKGGVANLTLTADDIKKIGADDKVYVHVGTATAGFKGTFTYLSVTAGEDSLVSELPQAVSYVESGMAQWAPTAKVMLPSDIDFSQYSKCQIKFTASDPTFEFHGIVGHKVNGADVTDPKYGVTSEGYFEVNLSKVKQEAGTEPFVVINTGKPGYTGSVTITKITFVK